MNLKQLMTIDPPLPSSRAQPSKLYQYSLPKHQRNKTQVTLSQLSSNTNYIYKTIQLDKTKMNFYRNNSAKSLINKPAGRNANSAKVNLNSGLCLSQRSEKENNFKTFFHSPKQQINKHILNIKRKQDRDNLVLFNQKRQIKGKLQKLVNTSLIYTANPNSMKGKEDKKMVKVSAIKNMFNSELKFSNIQVRPSSERKQSTNSSRFHDLFVTPEEIIFKNFSDKEIEIIRSDPKYFKMGENKMNEALMLKNKTLVDILREEEKGSKLVEIRKNVLKICKSPFKKVQILKEKEKCEYQKLLKENKIDYEVKEIFQKFKDYEKKFQDQKENSNSRKSFMFLNQLTINRKERRESVEQKLKVLERGGSKINKKRSSVFDKITKLSITKRNNSAACIESIKEID